MSLVIPQGYASAAWIFTSSAGTPNFVTTCGIRIGATANDYVATANLLFEAYSENLMPRTWNGLTLQTCQLTIGSEVGNGSVNSNLDPVAGSLSGADAALAMSVIVTKNTLRLGRKGRGRFFLPGLLANEDVNVNGDMSPATQAAIQSDVDDFYAQLQLNTEPYSTIPYLLHNDESQGITPIPSEILAFNVGQKVGWVRKRIR